MEKPKKCVYPKCHLCIYKDCRYNGLEYHEIVAQDKFDKEMEIVEPEVQKRRISNSKYSASEKGKASQRKYRQSEKGKVTQNKYNNSEKGKASRKRYSQTDKGKQNEKRKQTRKIESGRNAEYCRRYYYKKKMEMQGA